MAKREKYSIKVENVTKKFKVYFDKPNTLKERLVFWKNNKAEERTVLEDINLKIKKGETVVVISSEEGISRVRTPRGKIGCVWSASFLEHSAEDWLNFLE